MSELSYGGASYKPVQKLHRLSKIAAVTSWKNEVSLIPWYPTPLNDAQNYKPNRYIKQFDKINYHCSYALRFNDELLNIHKNKQSNHEADYTNHMKCKAFVP